MNIYYKDEYVHKQQSCQNYYKTIKELNKKEIKKGKNRDGWMDRADLVIIQETDGLKMYRIYAYKSEESSEKSDLDLKQQLRKIGLDRTDGYQQLRY